MRKIVNIPVGCRERYVPLEHPSLRRWVELGTHLSGVSDLIQPYCVGAPETHSIMLIATTGGSGVARTLTQEYALEPGTLLISVPGPGIEWAPREEQWSLVWWYLKPSAHWSHLLRGGTRLQAMPEAALLSAMVDGLISRLGRGDHVGDAADQALSEAILAQLEAVGPTTLPSEEPLGRLWQEVASRLHEPWPLAALAQRLRVSVPTFQRQMHRRHGTSAHRMLLELRMRRAWELVRRTEYPLRVIAEQVGYADAFTFSAAFHRHHGCTPSSLRGA